MIKERVAKKICDLEAEIENIREQIEYNDSVGQPILFLTQKLEEKQLSLESIKKLIDNLDAPLKN